jgi:hypothetical protein
MKGEHDVAWLAPALKVLTAHGKAAREIGTMKGERDSAWLGPAFAVLSSKRGTSTDSQGALKQALAKKRRTQKRNKRARKSS